MKETNNIFVDAQTKLKEPKIFFEYYMDKNLFKIAVECTNLYAVSKSVDPTSMTEKVH